MGRHNNNKKSSYGLCNKILKFLYGYLNLINLLCISIYIYYIGYIKKYTYIRKSKNFKIFIIKIFIIKILFFVKYLGTFFRMHDTPILLL